MSGLRKRRAALVAGAMMLCVPTTAFAQTGCWDQTQVAAAKVRDLQSRLMVATLRCSAMGVNVAPERILGSAEAAARVPNPATKRRRDSVM